MSDSVWPHRRQPPGSPIPGILQARTLEWVAISFSNAWKWKVKAKSLSRVWLLATPWTAAYQDPPSMGFSRQEYWSGVPFANSIDCNGLPRWLNGKEYTCQCSRCKTRGLDSWVRKILWRREWQPTPGFWPGESHGQRSLVGYSPWGCKELDMPKTTHTQIGETAGEPKNNSSFYWERLRWYNKKSIPVSKSSTQWVISHTFEIMKNKIERRQSLENIYSVQLCTERADFWFKSKTRQSRVSLDTRWFLPMFLEEIRAGRGGGGKHKIHYEWDELLRMYIFLMDWRCLKLTSFQEE